jgi:archaellum component FlaC
MKIDIKPSEFKAIIKSYEVELENLNKQYWDLENVYYDYIQYMSILDERTDKKVEVSKRINEIKPRLAHLKATYESLINDVRLVYYIDGANGIRRKSQVYEDMTIDDAAELLDEIESRKEAKGGH